MPTADLDQARAAKQRIKALIGERSDVVGIGLTRFNGGYAVKVNLSEAGAPLPAWIDGVPVQVEIVGTIRKQS